MKKTILILLIVIIVFWQVLPGLAEVDNSTINYLKNQTPDSWITMALIAVGETSLDLEHLKEVNGNLATDYEKTILALTAAGENPRTFGNINFISQLKTFHKDGQIGSSDLLNDDFWGILALVSAGENISSSIIQDSKSFILTHQNQDGGWSYSVSGSSDTNDTAVAIIALLEVQVSASDSAIVKAVDYLKLNQNDDGGFPYSPGDESDSGSDAWVVSAIYKLSEDPYNWTKNNNNPVDHLKSLQREDGSFKWIVSEDKGYSVLTAYAVIALTQNYYPIKRLYHLRIEGENNNICDAEVGASNALEIVENGAEACGYTYLTEDSNWGPYLRKINEEESYDLIGWLYFIDNEIQMVGAADYILKPGDEVLWYFGEWGWKPTRLTLASQKIDPGDNLEAQVEYFENSGWKSLAEATIYVDSQTFITDNDGKVDLIINDLGSYQVYADKSGYIRSNQVGLKVGEGTSQSVKLKVEIIQSAPDIAFYVDEDLFSINKDLIDFGHLTPSAQVSDQLLIKNIGDKEIYLEGIVSGEKIFVENITLDDLDWPEFEAVLGTEAEKDVLVGLTIPADWTNFGIKEGNLTFWATANQ